MTGGRLYLGDGRWFGQLLSLVSFASYACWGYFPGYGFGSQPGVVLIVAPLVGVGVKQPLELNLPWLRLPWLGSNFNLVEVSFGTGLKTVRTIIGEDLTFQWEPMVYLRIGIGYDWPPQVGPNPRV
jgi:hypothetical protein